MRRKERESETQAEQAASSVEDTTRQATESAKTEVSQKTRQVQEQAGRLSEQAKERISDQAEQQKHRATDQLEGVSSALRETSDTLRDREQDSMANMVENVAQQVDRFSEYLRTHSAGDMMADAEDYARREPELFLGSAALLGLLGARFLKSSSQASDGRRTRRTMPSRSRSEGEYAASREERRRPTVAGTGGAEMPDPSRSETR